jgi:hypothetical protein
MLIRAIRLAETGRRVLLADRARVAGGGWAAPDALGLERVEVGAHVLENRPALMRALTGDLGASLVPDPCICLVAGRRTPMGLTRAAFHLATAVKALARGEADKARRGLRSAWRTAADAGRPYQYPRDGAWGLLATLRARFERLGGVIQHGLEVRGIRVEGAAVVCDTDAGEMRPQLAVIASRAWAPVTIDGRAEPLTVEHLTCWNALLRLEGAGGAPFSYVEILGDPVLKRVRDISGLARPQVGDGERLFIVQYRRDLALDDTSLGRQLAEQLTRVRLLTGPGCLLAVARTDAPLTTLTDATLTRISRRAGGRIEALPTSDLADGFVSAYDRLTPVA